MLPAGAVVAKDFRVARTLGSGAMGDVYVVEQLSTGRERALKLMSPNVAASAQARERFVLEARVGAKIESEHVVEVVTAGVDDALGAPYLVMELLKGRDLEKHIERGPLSPAEAVVLFRQLGHALSRAHAMGVVHRDLKPANLFLAEPRGDTGIPFTLKILDFGIAKLVTDASKAQTQGLGTPLFMAPEQTQQRGTVSPASDVWAVGLIAYQALAGRVFWKARTMAELMNEILFEPIPAASARAAEHHLPVTLPAGFDAWFARAVARDPAARFPSAAEAIPALLAVLGPAAQATPAPPSAPSAAAPSAPSGPGATQRAALAEPVATLPSPAALPPTPVAPRSSGGSRAPWIVLGVVVVLGAGAAAWALAGDGARGKGKRRPGKREHVEATAAPSVDASTSPECSAYLKELADCADKYPQSPYGKNLGKMKKDIETGLGDPDTAPLMEAMCKSARELVEKECAAPTPAPPPASDGE